MRSPKGNSFAKTRQTTYRSLRWVHQFLHSSPFYPTPNILCITTLFNPPYTPKSAPSRGDIHTPWNTCSLHGPTRLSIQNCISLGSAVLTASQYATYEDVVHCYRECWKWNGMERYAIPALHSVRNHTATSCLTRNVGQCPTWWPPCRI